MNLRPLRLPRPVFGALAALALALVLLASAPQTPLAPIALAALPDRSQSAQSVPADLIPSAVSSVSPFGTSDTSELDFTKSTRASQLAREAGITSVRTSISWRGIEPTRDQLKWAHYDGFFQTYKNLGLLPYVLVMDNPAWAATTPCGPVKADALADLEALFRDLAARYPHILYWGMYNEVDNAKYSSDPAQYNWGGCFGENEIDGNGKPDYEDYALMAHRAWRGVHAGNPNAKFVFGGVSHDNFVAAGAPSDYPRLGGCCYSYPFLDNLFAYMRDHPLPNNEQYGDVFGFNNYSVYNRDYWEVKFPPFKGPASKAEGIRQKMAQYGLSFPLLIGEMGAQVTTSSAPEGDGITLQEQARKVVQMYAQGLSAGILVIHWWPFADFKDYPKGLLYYDLKPKPAYDAYKVLTKQLGGHTFIRRLTGIRRVEGYVFDGSEGEKTVLWTKRKTKNVTFAAKRVRIVTLFGSVSEKTDGGTGSITVKVGLDPLYVTVLQ